MAVVNIVLHSLQMSCKNIHINARGDFQEVSVMIRKNSRSNLDVLMLLLLQEIERDDLPDRSSVSGGPRNLGPGHL